MIISKDTWSVEGGKAKVFVDGKEVLTLDPRAVGWTHYTPQIILQEEETKEHLVEVKMLPEDLDKKLTILGFGVIV